MAPHRSAFDLVLQYELLAIVGMGTKTPTTSLGINSVVSTLVREGRTVEARRFLVQTLPVSVRRQPTPQRAGANDLLYVDMIVQELRKLQFPANAIDVYLRGLRRCRDIKVVGYDPRTALKNNLVVAFGELSPELFVKSMEARADDEHAPELHLFVPETQGSTSKSVGPKSGRLQSRWRFLLSRIAKEPELLERLRTALDRFRKQDPNDPSALILAALLEFDAGDETRIQEATDRILRAMETNAFSQKKTQGLALPLIEESVEPQRALWLVARECLSRPTLAAAGRRIGEQAIVGDEKSDSFLLPIVDEWTEITTDSSDKQMLERLKQ